MNELDRSAYNLKLNGVTYIEPRSNRQCLNENARLQTRLVMLNQDDWTIRCVAIVTLLSRVAVHS